VVSVVVLQNSVDLPNVELGSCTGNSVASSRDENELTFIKVEEVTDRTEEEDPEPETSTGVRTEPEVSRILSVESISQIPRIKSTQSRYCQFHTM
jgi:hypothetical protein